MLPSGKSGFHSLKMILIQVMLKDGGLNNRGSDYELSRYVYMSLFRCDGNVTYKQIKFADDLVKSEDKMEDQLFTKMKSPPKYSDSCE